MSGDAPNPAGVPAPEAAPSHAPACAPAPEAQLARVPLLAAELAAAPTAFCVTGATGYLAGPIIERLLRAGHTVHATCRDPSNRAALGPLEALPGADKRLRLFKADLVLRGSFDAALHGCTHVIHVAAPVVLNKIKRGEGRSRLVDPMLQGVEHLLEGVNRTPTVRRVVMTSSVSALHTSVRDKPPGHVFGDADWNATASDAFLPYAYGKMLSERRAWELAGQQSRWDLVTVLPSIVFGPTVGPCGGSESVEAMRDILWAGLLYPAAGDMGTAVVDTRDCAAVHCLAAVTPGASGRYIAHAHSSSMYDITHAVASRIPGFRPTIFLAPYFVVWLVAPWLNIHRDVLAALWGKPAQYDTRRTSSELGLAAWVPLVDTVVDMLNDMAAKGVIKMTQQQQQQKQLQQQ